MVQRLARGPFKAEIRVRFPLALPTFLLFPLLLLGILPAVPIWAQINSTTRASPKADRRVINAPYSAQRHFTSIQKQADGTTERSDSHGSEARDSQGRTYRADERQWTYEDQGKSVLKTEMLYRIDDPVSNTETNWRSSTKEVKVIHWSDEPNGGTRYIACDAFASDALGNKVEKLGVRTIEGFLVEGTRSSYEISGAPDQNGKTPTVVHETWFCPELKIVVLETNDDPRSGTTRNELVQIVRGEPDVAKYRAPSDYVVHDVRDP